MDNDTNPSVTHPDETSDHVSHGDGFKGVIDRFLQFSEVSKLAYDELTDLYEKDSQSEDFNEMLEDLAYHLLAEDEEFKANIVLMRQAKDEVALNISRRQKELLEHYKKKIIMEAGLPTEASVSDIEAGKEKVLQLLKDADQKGNIRDTGDILKTLGMLSQDSETGEDRFTYPEGLFPASVDEKWQNYIGSVLAHFRAVRELESHIGHKHKVEDADNARKLAHNIVTRDIHAILALDTLTDEEWGFQKTRKLIGKMRDNKFPTVETAESATTEAALKAAFGSNVIGLLSHKISELRQ